MQVIKVSIPSDFPWLRQMPINHPAFSDIEFVINKDIAECDCWIVYDNLLKPETVLCPPDKTILFTGEPSTVRVYNKQFTRQFNTLITNQINISHPNKHYSQPSLPWLVGVEYEKQKRNFSSDKYLTSNDLMNIDFSNKSKLISVITSNKTLSKGHRKRLDFVMYLKSILGDQLEIFGSGFNDIADKMDALKDFKYTIVIENSQHPHYWTEKLADAFLCECYPLYYGCPNIYDYFKKESLMVINIEDFISTSEIIVKALESDLYEMSLNEIRVSKNLVLTKYNFFWQAIDFLKLETKVRKELVTLYPEKPNVFDKFKTHINRYK